MLKLIVILFFTIFSQLENLPHGVCRNLCDVSMLMDGTVQHVENQDDTYIGMLKDSGRQYIQLQKLRNVLIVIIIVLIVALFLFAFFFYKQLRVKQHLKTQNIILSKQMDAEIIQSEQLEEIVNELEKLAIVARKSPNAIVIFNEKGEIDWVNEGFTALYGYSYAEFVLERGFSIYKASYSDDILKNIEFCLKTKQNQVYTTLVKNKFGKKIWIQTTLTPVLDENGGLKKLIAIDADVTEIKNDQEKLKLQKQSITESLRYAKKIQQTILPDISQMRKYFPNSFVLFKPRDIVSGDFYWLHPVRNKVFLAIVDCTGHGVPGAFMSIICKNILNYLIVEQGIERVDDILKAMNKEVKSVLRKNDPSIVTLDGADISLCCFDKDFNTIEFAGSQQSLFYIYENKLIEVKGDRMSLGVTEDEKFNVKMHKFDTKTMGMIYLCTDGYVDQFGGSANKKFLIKQFKELLITIQDLSISEQENILSANLYDWMGSNQQLDDILVVGIRLNEAIK